MSLSAVSNERLYDALAEAIDRAGPEQEALFLTKLALLLANRMADEEAVMQSIAAALQILEPPSSR